MLEQVNQLNDVVKSLEAGSYDAAPSALVQGSALLKEDLSAVLNNATYGSEHIKLQQMCKITPCKSVTSEFVRQLSYGSWGGAAQFEGNVGVEDTSQYVRCVVPMAFYSKRRNVSIQSTYVATFDGKGSEERANADAAILMSGEIEFDCFRGYEDFSNGGVFDGNPYASDAGIPSMHGLGLQVRQSDFQSNAKDQMFASYGSNDTVVLNAGGGAVTQGIVEDASLRSALGFGQARKLVVDPVALSAYNKISYNMERIMLSGSAQGAVGSDLRKQWTSNGTVGVESSHFLRGRSGPDAPRPESPDAPASIVSAVDNGTLGTTGLSGAYTFYATSVSEKGESYPCAAVTTASITANHGITVTIAPSGTPKPVRFFRVYRSQAGGSAASARFIGAVVAAPSGNTVFTDLGNRSPGFTTGFLLNEGAFQMNQLAPYTSLKLAVAALNIPTANYTFTCLSVMKPRTCVLVDNIKGTV